LARIKILINFSPKKTNQFL